MTKAQKAYAASREYATRGLQMLVNNLNEIDKLRDGHGNKLDIFDDIVMRAFFKRKEIARQELSALHRLIESWLS